MFVLLLRRQRFKLVVLLLFGAYGKPFRSIIGGWRKFILSRLYRRGRFFFFRNEFGLFSGRGIRPSASDSVKDTSAVTCINASARHQVTKENEHTTNINQKVRLCHLPSLLKRHNKARLTQKTVLQLIWSKESFSRPLQKQ